VSEPVYKRCKCRGQDGKDVGPGCPGLRRADGSWNPRHGTWYFALELPPGPGGKRRPRLRRGGFASRDAALAAREDAKGQLGRGADPSLRITTGDYLLQWLSQRADLKPTTRRNYRLAFATYWVPLIGHVPLTELTADHVAEAFNVIREWNASLAAGTPVRKYQRHVGPSAMHKLRIPLRAALNDAVDSGKRAFNPAERRRIRMEAVPTRKPLAWTDARTEAFWASYRKALAASKITRHDKEFLVWRTMTLRPVPMMVWTPDQAGRFLDHAYAAKSPFADLYELYMLTGMRRGEGCGLSWPHVDFDAAELLVGKARIQVGWEVADMDPKSEAGWRPIALDEHGVALLRKRKTQQAADRLAWGEAWQGTGIVFTLENGAAPHPDRVTAEFERQAFAARLPPVGIQGLRHGWATYALAGGVDIKVVQERLGHSTSKLTRDVYTTVLTEVARQAAKTVSDMIPRARRTG
jgi:integrase